MQLWQITILLAAVWVSLFQYCRTYNYRDPSSFFYDEKRAYDNSYSALRERESNNFLEKAQDSSNLQKESSKIASESNDSAWICIGTPSLRREKEEFLGRTVASLLDTLSTEERSRIHLAVLLADEDVKQNSAFETPWLENLTDEILIYDSQARESSSKTTLLSPTPDGSPSNPGQLQRNQHVRLDYANLIERCQKTSAPYFLLIEDDVITSRDWFQRLVQSLEEADAKQHSSDWLYLRLFYSETFMGWNNEEAPTYALNILVLYLFAAAMMMLYRLFHRPAIPGKGTTGRLKSAPSSLLYMTFWISSFIALFFMAGRLSSDPYRKGVREMPNYGCCAQGLAIPERHLDALKGYLRDPTVNEPGDATIEAFADENRLRKLAMVPSVLQHVGSRGSSDRGKRKTTWNFSFEQNPRR